MNLRALQEEKVRRALVKEREKRKTDSFKYDWPKHARPEQLAPDWPWRTWLVLAGRGFGKTRIAMEQVRIWVRDNEFVNLIGATASDARDILIEGESGLLAICPKAERPSYLPSKQKLSWPNGAISLIFTSEEPERLRGKQHQKLAMDELASWKLPETYDQAMLGLRIGKNPQSIITTTPRPTKLIKDLVANPTTHVTRGTTYDNRANLAPAFFEEIIRKFEGTRMGRQELNAEILIDNPAALWKREDIDRSRVRPDQTPTLARIVVAIDPSVTSDPESDDAGIIVAGVARLNNQLHGYVLADYTTQGSPDVWASRAVGAYKAHHADRIVAETNNGGDLVEMVIRTVDKNVPYRKVHASRGKAIRAEPIAALYEQCVAVGTLIETARGPVPIESVMVGDQVWTRDGLKNVLWSGQTGVKPTVTVRAGRSILSCTEDHPVYVVDKDFVHAGQLVPQKDILLAWAINATNAGLRLPRKVDVVVPARPSNDGRYASRFDLLLTSTVRVISHIPRDTGAAVVILETGSCTATCGPLLTAQFRSDGTSIISMAIQAITGSKIWCHLIRLDMLNSIRVCRTLLRSWGAFLKRDWIGGKLGSQRSIPVRNAKKSSSRQLRGSDSVLRSVIHGITIDGVEKGPVLPVYNLSVEGTHEFFANGLLVHNCRIHHVGSFPELEDEMVDYDPTLLHQKSPNRMDALVWAISDLTQGPSRTGNVSELRI